MPCRLLGILVAGLGDNSRIRKQINGIRGNVTDVLLAQILDGVRWLVWAQTEDAQKGRNRPKSVASEFFISEDQNKPKSTSIEEFEAFRNKIIRG